MLKGLVNRGDIGSTMKPIVTLTLNPSIDASSETDDVRPMRKNHISNERFDPGGGGINVAGGGQSARRFSARDLSCEWPYRPHIGQDDRRERPFRSSVIHA